MRLAHIAQLKAQRGSSSQPLYGPPEAPLSAQTFSNPVLPTLKRQLLAAVAPRIFPLKLWATKRRFGQLLPAHDILLTTGYRFAQTWAQRRFLRDVSLLVQQRVLLAGTHFNTPEARQWFQRPIQSLHLLDIVDWSSSFKAEAAHLKTLCRPSLQFHHGTLDKLPLPDASLDMIESRAVLEHVGNMSASAAEMARVLAPGGYAFHGFGPLYFTHGGDHCIGAYGLDHGYDHLLLDNADYDRRLRDETAFDQFGKEASDARYWAIQGIFSYLKPEEYLNAFAPHFDFQWVLGIINEAALTFRSSQPERWQHLLDAGLSECDLLLSSLIVLLKKKPLS
jgi:SAM-dependent methyltransferase